MRTAVILAVLLLCTGARLHVALSLVNTSLVSISIVGGIRCHPIILLLLQSLYMICSVYIIIS